MVVVVGTVCMQEDYVPWAVHDKALLSNVRRVSAWLHADLHLALWRGIGVSKAPGWRWWWWWIGR